MIEVHHAPEKAICDGAQSLFPHSLKNWYELKIIAPVVGKKL